MKRIKYVMLLLVLWSPAALLASQPFEQLFVFGDSLSDTGNLASVVGDFPDPPYAQNRVSNGPVAVEVMADGLGLPLQTSRHLLGIATGNNYAVAGASAARGEVIDLETQVALFLANHGGVAPAHTLYVMFIGGNDVRKARDTADWPSAVQTVTAAAQAVATQMQILAASGAQHWLVVNAPDIGSIPETHLIAAAIGIPEFPARATALTTLFNDALKRQVRHLAATSDIEVEQFDLFKVFSRIIRKGDTLGFDNTTDACFSSQFGQFTPACEYGANFDQYIFFDEIHPTARVHAMVGTAMARKVLEDQHEQNTEHGKVVSIP